MIPNSLTFVVLCLAAYRATRLAGWDDFPLAVKIRAWVIGERRIVETVEYDVEGLVPVPTGPLLGSDSPFTAEPELESVGKGLFDRGVLSADEYRAANELPAYRITYARPTLAHMIFCPFCIGFHISLATWVAWLVWHPVMYGLAPFAISGAVGLVAKNLDP